MLNLAVSSLLMLLYTYTLWLCDLFQARQEVLVHRVLRVSLDNQGFKVFLEIREALEVQVIEVTLVHLVSKVLVVLMAVPGL